MKALVVDDDQDIANLIAMYLRAQGLSVSTAGHGIEALEMIRESLPDVVVLDVDMPYLDGIETLRQLRASTATAHLPVILLTAKDQPADMFAGWQSGADLYITKPFETEELLRCIQRISGGQAEA